MKRASGVDDRAVAAFIEDTIGSLRERIGSMPAGDCLAAWSTAAAAVVAAAIYGTGKPQYMDRDRK